MLPLAFLLCRGGGVSSSRLYRDFDLERYIPNAGLTVEELVSGLYSDSRIHNDCAASIKSTVGPASL